MHASPPECAVKIIQFELALGRCQVASLLLGYIPVVVRVAAVRVVVLLGPAVTATPTAFHRQPQPNSLGGSVVTSSHFHVKSGALDGCASPRIRNLVTIVVVIIIFVVSRGLVSRRIMSASRWIL